MYDIGSQIVHPLHGAGVIEEIVQQKIEGEKLLYYRLRLSENRMTVMIPVDGADRIGIRPVSSFETYRQVMRVFEEDEAAITRNWNARYHENLVKIKSGDLCEVARVIKALSILEKMRGLASGERKMLYNAKKILYSELALIAGKEYALIEQEINQAIGKKTVQE